MDVEEEGCQWVQRRKANCGVVGCHSGHMYLTNYLSTVRQPINSPYICTDSRYVSALWCRDKTKQF